MDENTKAKLDIINRNVANLLNKHYGHMFGSSASHRYYENKDTKDRYFYTTQRINHKGNPRYVAGIYRFIKTKNHFKLVKKVGFAKKKLAIAWAEKMKEKEKVAKEN